jgi:multiple sugar transport system substrate-binding protein
MRTNDDDIFLLTSANVVVSLDDRITKELKRDDYYPVVWQSRTGPGGELGSALVATAPYVMFYNVDLFQKAGVKAPTDWEKDNWTLDDLEAAMAKVSKKQGDRVDVYAWESDSYWWQVGLWNEGLPWYSEDETKAIWRTPEAKRALERYQRWYKEGWAVPPMGNKGQQIVQLFNSNLLAMVWRDTAFETSIKADVNWDVAPIPKGSKRDGCFHNDRNFTIPTASKVRDEAWEALKWLFTMDGEEGGQFEFAKNRWGVPVLKKAAEGPLFNDPKKKPKSIQVYFQGVQKAWPIPDNPMGEVFQVPWRRSDPMFTGQESVDKFLAASEELVDKVIKQVGWSKKMNARGYRLEGAIEKAGRLDEEEAATKPQAKPEAPAKKP